MCHALKRSKSKKRNKMKKVKKKTVNWAKVLKESREMDDKRDAKRVIIKI
jgi:hypothetical protein